MDDKEKSMAMMTIYHLWLARSDARDAEAIEDLARTDHQTMALVEEWENLKSTPPPYQSRRVEHWLPPDPGWYKVNADGAFDKDTDQGGGGVVIRDHHGVFLARTCHFSLT